MYTVILLIVLTALSIFSIIIGNKKHLEILEGVSIIVSIVCFIASIICITKCCTVKSNKEKIIYEYNSTSAIIKDMNVESYGNLPNLTEKY